MEPAFWRFRNYLLCSLFIRKVSREKAVKHMNGKYACDQQGRKANILKFRPFHSDPDERPYKNE